MQISRGGHIIQAIIGPTKCLLITIVHNRKVGWRIHGYFGGAISITLGRKELMSRCQH